MKKKYRKRNILLILIIILLLILWIAAIMYAVWEKSQPKEQPAELPSDLPPYSGILSIEINGNKPLFSPEEINNLGYASFSPLDSLGRCGAAAARVGPDTIPTEPRGRIGDIKPSGWHTTRYDDLISDKYLYNRCHLIAYMLCGENDNELNLITGTRHMNTEGMLPFEIKVAEYIRQTANHVYYRVTPIFEGNNLVASGVLMEALSLEDGGSGCSFCVYVYNIQPGITINYDDGSSCRENEK